MPNKVDTYRQSCIGQLVNWLMPYSRFFATGGDQSATTSTSDGTVHLFEVSGSRYYAASDGIPKSDEAQAVQPGSNYKRYCTSQRRVTTFSAQSSFQGLILAERGPIGNGFVDEAREPLASTKGNRWTQITSLQSAHLRPGVYILKDAILRPVYRVYGDHQKAFLTGLKLCIEHIHSSSSTSPGQTTHQRFGHKPYVIAFVTDRWSSGAAVSPEQHAEGPRRLEVYRTWLPGTVLGDRRNLVVLRISPVEPQYRDQPTDSPSYQTATDGLFLGPILCSPDVVVPIGEIPYHSRFTGVEEYLPVAVNVLGAPCMDCWVLDSVKRVLRESGRPAEVRTGWRMYS